MSNIKEGDNTKCEIPKAHKTQEGFTPLKFCELGMLNSLFGQVKANYT